MEAAAATKRIRTPTAKMLAAMSSSEETQGVVASPLAAKRAKTTATPATPSVAAATTTTTTTTVTPTLASVETSLEVWQTEEFRAMQVSETSFLGTCYSEFM